MPKIDLPLAYPLTFRSTDTTKDSKMVNCYKETIGGIQYAVKRPGKTSFTVTPNLTPTGTGLWTYNGKLYSVTNGTLSEISTGTSITIGTGLLLSMM